MISAAQLDLLHHTLGLRPDWREPSRNHFMAGPGHHAQSDLEALESLGLMARGRTPRFCHADDVLFHATDAGREHAIAMLPAPRKRSKYEQYLDSDADYSFADFLGIEVPRREYSYDRRTPNHFRLVSSRATGEYALTLKDAKASYKEALRARRMVPA